MTMLGLCLNTPQPICHGEYCSRRLTLAPHDDLNTNGLQRGMEGLR